MLPRISKLAFAFAFALPLIAATSSYAQLSLSSHYEFHDLSHPNAIYSVPLGLNNLRMIVGTYADFNGVFHGYLWQNGKFTDIDFPGAPQVPYGGSTAGGINDRGDVAGAFYGADGFLHGYRMARPERCGDNPSNNEPSCKPVFTQLDFPGAAQLANVSFELGPGLGTAGIGLNDFSQVVGLYATHGQYSNGFVEYRGSYLPIDNPKSSHTTGNGSKCFGISNFGVLACDYQTQKSPTAPQITHGFLQDGATIVPIEFPGSAKAGFGTQVTNVNIFGIAVGVYFDGTAFNAMLWSQGKFYTVNFPGTPYNELHGINDRGDVTGAYDTDPSGATLHGYVAFLK